MHGWSGSLEFRLASQACDSETAARGSVQTSACFSGCASTQITMRTLHLYLFRQVLATLVMTVLVFTFVLLLGESLKEMVALLVNGTVGMGTMVQAIALLIPFVLVFALPMGLLTAMLLVFGRFSADQELTATRACGVSLVALIQPCVLLSLLCAALCAWINLDLAPRCRVAYKRLLLHAGTAQATSWLVEKSFIRDFPGCILYAGKVEGTQLEDVLLYQLDEQGRKKNYLRADRGHIEINSTNRTLTLTLYEGWELLANSGIETAWHSFGELQVPPFSLPAEFSEKPKINNMTAAQLWEELRGLEQRLQTTSPVEKLPSADLQKKLKEAASTTADVTEPVRVQIHRQVSFSLACVSFTLVGIPLGIRAHRRETSVGFAVALVLVLLYYSFFILAQSLETHAEYFPHLLLWLPNFLFQAVGIVLLWRANRGL